MHVVFSAKNQPKMIWATFESVYNARNQSYDYLGEDNHSRTRSADTRGNWLFSNRSNHSINVSHMHVDKMGRIVGDTDKNSIQMKIGPTNVGRAHPWGSDKSDSRDNTDIININKSAASQLSAGDVRKHYIMIGTIWGDQDQGARKLANSAIETFQSDSNCFGCHAASKLSHIWDQLSRPQR
jgi:hypothetical protein